MRVSVSLFLLSTVAGFAVPVAPVISVSGGLQFEDALEPLSFTWNSAVPLQGAGWTPGESVSVSLMGPLNSLGVPATTVPLGTLTAGDQGSFSSSLAIPYDQGMTGPQTRIPRPGSYSVRATGAASGSATADYRINIVPATYLGSGSAIDWSHERGTRDGVLPGPLKAYSPERSDPNWISVWDSRPVGVYGSATEGESGANQSARVSYEDDPLSHYAHDTNFYLLPDSPYRWTVGTANYYSNGEDDSGVALGRVEVEWEALNSGNAASYDTGQIGLPSWAMPITGDRIYVVGRWVLDAGHPDVGDRTEIHPPRLLAAMRTRPAVSAGGAAASQVDIYVSGHGGGANQYPSGMDALLDQGGYGGGRLRDVLSASDQKTYYQPGPLPLLESPIIVLLSQTITGSSPSGPIYPEAGPSAFPWGTPAPESQSINDMDYDFDVPLPPPPAGATSVQVEVTTHSQHTTAVTEVITYPGSGSGLPTAAHVHLPYQGADNGIYARTLKFFWNNGPAPMHHFRVQLQSVNVTSLPGDWRLWGDVSGQWSYLPAATPALLHTTQGQSIPLSGPAYDVYLGSGDTLAVLVQGYRAQCVDQLFGTLFGTASYDAGIQLLTKCGPINNDDLGGALLTLPALPSSQGSYVVQADASGQQGGGAFQVKITVDYVGSSQPASECAGRAPLTPSINAGGVVGAGLDSPAVQQISPGGLASVFGQNFAPPGTARQAGAADLVNGILPRNLACTCVAVNQHLSPMLYVTPGQINFQTPGPFYSPVTVSVIANCSAAGAATSSQSVTTQPATPEFFYLARSTTGASPVVAFNAITGAVIGPAGVAAGISTAPAKPGDYVALYATGLGLTVPAVAPGVLPAQAALTVSPVSVSLNNQPLPPTDILYAGAAPGFAGVYQINIRIPAGTPAGNLPLALTIDGVSTPGGAFLAVGQ